MSADGERSVTTNVDPTNTSTLRKRFKREFRTRWRTIRGDVRAELLEKGMLERIREDASITSHSFRQFLKRTIQDDLYEPTQPRQIQNGNHWTATYVRDAYAAGLRRAARQLRSQDVPEQVVEQATFIRHDAHQDALDSVYGAIYDDVEDAYFAVVTDVAREFRSLVEESDTGDREVISGINDRIDTAGVYRTEAAAANRVIEAFNGALIIAYGIADVDAVARIPEAVTGDEQRNNYRTHTHDHAHPYEHGFDPAFGTDFIARHFREPDEEPLDRERTHLDFSSIRERAAEAASSIAGIVSGGEEPETVGDPDVDDRVAWQTAGDEDVCEECRQYAGKAIRYEAVVNGDVEFPPLHPNCRCVLVPIADYE